jgi:hypothetical protein
MNDMGYGLQATGASRKEALCILAVARRLWPVAALFAVSACSNIEPWVKPYERQNIADPIMSFDLNPVSSSYMDHVYEAREGARGALGGGGGGCGCN